jgi:hypothetical protein
LLNPKSDDEAFEGFLKVLAKIDSLHSATYTHLVP